MIESLEEAFHEVAQLPEDEQRHIVEIIRQEIASEKRWQTLFHDPRSELVLRDWWPRHLRRIQPGKQRRSLARAFSHEVEAYQAISRPLCRIARISATTGK